MQTQFIGDLFLHQGITPHEPVVKNCPESLVMAKPDIIQWIITSRSTKHPQSGGILQFKLPGLDIFTPVHPGRPPNRRCCHRRHRRHG